MGVDLMGVDLMGRSPMPADGDAADPRPLLSVDIDGVLARPPFGVTPTMNRHTGLLPRPAPRHTATPGPPSRRDRLLQATYYRLRYARRSPRRGAAEALAAAAVSYRLIALTGRDWRGRPATERWLDRHHLLAYFDTVRMNDSARHGPRLRAARFKEAVCAQLGVVRHIEDDPATAALLARNGVAVDLIDWPRSRGLDFPPGVTRRADLQALAHALRAQPPGRQAGSSQPPAPGR